MPMPSSFRTTGGSPPPSYVSVDPQYNDNLPPVDQTTPLLPSSPPKVSNQPRFVKWIFMFITVYSGIVTFTFLQHYFSSSTYIPSTPIGTTWVNLTASLSCSSIGTRTYTANLPDMPEGFHPRNFCSDIPIIIHGRTIEHPFSCWSEFTQCQRHNSDDGQLHAVPCTITRGEWVVDFEEGGCEPTWDPVPLGTQNPVPDPNCLSSKTRAYSAYMSPSRVPPGLDPHQSCLKTPATIDHQVFLPEECRLEKTSAGEDVYVARFTVEDPKCAPKPIRTTWINLTASPHCTSIGTRTYTAHLPDMPEGFHPIDACSDIPITIHGRTIPHPFSCYSELTECERYTEEEDGELRTVPCTITRGKWVVDFDEGGCIPTWDPVPAGTQTPIPDEKCLGYKTRGYSAHRSRSTTVLFSPKNVTSNEHQPEEEEEEEKPSTSRVS
ncbi:hypothetical protein PQX77_013422 [Marasmius sp. AFHP31]|nr:hypothetical protein PQX77_013422 [Marasmius sp. AFHP31]